MIQPSLEISYSPFDSEYLLTLEKLLHQSGTPMNITIIDDHISYITHISQVPSTPAIKDNFPMNTSINIYMVAIDNEKSSLAYSDVQLL